MVFSGALLQIYSSETPENLLDIGAPPPLYEKKRTGTNKHLSISLLNRAIYLQRRVGICGFGYYFYRHSF